MKKIRKIIACAVFIGGLALTQPALGYNWGFEKFVNWITTKWSSWFGSSTTQQTTRKKPYNPSSQQQKKQPQFSQQQQQPQYNVPQYNPQQSTTQQQTRDSWKDIPGAIYFYTKGKPYYEFTNFYESPIFLDGKSWPTSEHYYQAQKFVGTPNASLVETIRTAKYPKEVFKIAQQNDDKVRPDWKKISLDTMLNALYAKFTQHKDLKTKLLATDDKILVEDAKDKDDFFGAGADYKGNNVLGQLLMLVRKNLKNPSSLLNATVYIQSAADKKDAAAKYFKDNPLPTSQIPPSQKKSVKSLLFDQTISQPSNASGTPLSAYKYAVASVLPLIVDQGVEYVLLGRNANSQEWSAFGGEKNSKESHPVATASRTFWEQMGGQKNAINMRESDILKFIDPSKSQNTQYIIAQDQVGKTTNTVIYITKFDDNLPSTLMANFGKNLSKDAIAKVKVEDLIDAITTGKTAVKGKIIVDTTTNKVYAFEFALPLQGFLGEQLINFFNDLSNSEQDYAAGRDAKIRFYARTK